MYYLGYLKDRFLTRAYDIAVILLTIKVISSATIYFDFPKLVQNGLMVVAYFCILLHILQNRYRLRVLVSFFIITILVLYSSYKMHNLLYLSSWFLIMGAVKYDLDRTIKLMFSVTLVIFIFSIILSSALYFLGYDHDLLINIRRGDTVAFAFGFVHPNKFAVILSNLCLMWLWLKRESLQYFYLLALLSLQIFFFLFTKTRTALIIFILVSFFLFLYKRYKSSSFQALLYTFSVVGGGFWGLTYLFQTSRHPISIMVDRALTGRIQFAAYAKTHFGFTFLGQMINASISWDPVWKLNSFTFDSLYSFLWYNAGAIWFFILCYVFIKLRYRLDSIDIIFLSCWALYAATETDTILPAYGFQILFISQLFEQQNLERKQRSIKHLKRRRIVVKPFS
ncbi:MAG: hypothetical protein MSS16_03220 [Streptococcus orisratti]|uniref:hypothetical protein n=1 Tax=Streptococcus orisratti TaxID=114652 RepID=UPI002357188A|nr:hypothetical protein [Streptococcus orisratti]MCI7677096.1 hypothetical protein [Streptococcus orisratti]MDY5635503.1 hypothetical protein [Streptococcus orisratti]